MQKLLLNSCSNLNLSKRFTLAALLIFSFVSCGNPQEQKPGDKTYYDLKDFVSGQVESLTFLKPTVDKQLSSAGKNETMSTKDVDWKKELDLFAQADLNKPAYKQSYLVSRPDSLTYEYTLKVGESLPVQSLEIKLDSSTGNPSRVRAILLSKNKLYESKKDVELQCKLLNGKWILTSYQIKGFQRLMILDPREFSIIGKVQF